jgi:hypothetical protein
MIGFLLPTLQQSCPFVKTFRILVLKNQRAAISRKLFLLSINWQFYRFLNQEIGKPANSAIV